MEQDDRDETGPELLRPEDNAFNTSTKPIVSRLSIMFAGLLLMIVGATLCGREEQKQSEKINGDTGKDSYSSTVF